MYKDFFTVLFFLFVFLLPPVTGTAGVDVGVEVGVPPEVPPSLGGDGGSVFSGTPGKGTSSPSPPVIS